MKIGFISVIAITMPISLYAEMINISPAINLFKLGGLWMWFLLALSVLSFSLILEKIYYFRKTKISNPAVLKNISSHIQDIDKLKKFLLLQKSLSAEIIKKSLSVKTQKEFLSKVERETSIAVSKLGKGINLIGTIGSVAPLVGFLGTVSGMITAFGNIANADEVSAKLVAGGIYTALITTAAGLIIAIPSIMAHNYFVYKIENFTTEIEQLTNIILDANIFK